MFVQQTLLRDAIGSALQQTYSDTEVIVVDDGSTDNSREIIASYGKQITAVFKNNGGQASAFNAGARRLSARPESG
jgi:glycosyltransferase involved in cell wall biosynthesis